MMPRKDRASPFGANLAGGGGFTLIELLVVITIVIIALSISVVFIGSMSSNQIKNSASLVKAVFMRTSQLASTQGMMYFIVFDKEKSFMSIYEDSDENNQFNKSIDELEGDKLVGETIALAKGISFSDKTPLFEGDEPFVGFKSNGSLVLPEGISDLSLKKPEEENADIILEQKGKSGKIYIDFTVTTGKIIGMVYREN